MAEEVQKEKLPENVVFIGQKPPMAYVLGVVTQLTNGQREVFIKARGRSISKAVDVAEIVRRKFIKDVQIKGVDIGTEQIEVEGRGKLNVSTMAIVLGK